MSNLNREYDLVVLGASGFTGQFVVEEVARSVSKDQTKWAIAGRNVDKLRRVLEIATKETGIDVRNIDKIVADVENEDSIKSMCKRTRLVVNCVGPYRFYGHQVVKACVESSTHHVDISGEPQYLETMQLLYHKTAEEKGIYIVGACGWGSIPCDVGVQHLKKNFDGELNAVESYMKIETGPNGHKTNYGTWHSAIHGFANFSELKNIRRRLYTEVFSKRLPQSKHKLQRRVLPFRNPIGNGWAMVFPGSDRSVIKRTQQYNYENLNERPTQIETYITFPSFFYVIGVLILGAIFATFASFGFGRRLLERYPAFFSFGIFDRNGPTREQIKAAKFQLNIVGKGWKEKLSEPTDEPAIDENKTVVVRVKGLDPGYLSTSTCLVQAGLTILYDYEKMPKNGGVLTPGAAFENTNLIQRLANHELTYEITDIN